MSGKLPISAVVVVCDESLRLGQCLDSLFFCDELIVYDLGSTDGSLEIAQRRATAVIPHAPVPVVELLLREIIAVPRNAWILRLDPDEVFPASLIPRVEQVIREECKDGLLLPFQFRFLGKALRHGKWGGRRFMLGRIFHRDHVIIEPGVHWGIRPKPGYSRRELASHETGSVQHYWADSLKDLFRKHWRYIRLEGGARYAHGTRTNIPAFLLAFPRELSRQLIDNQSWRDGVAGIFLAFFAAWYEGMSAWSLLLYEFRRKIVTNRQ